MARDSLALCITPIDLGEFFVVGEVSRAVDDPARDVDHRSCGRRVDALTERLDRLASQAHFFPDLSRRCLLDSSGSTSPAGNCHDSVPSLTRRRPAGRGHQRR